MTKPNKYFEVPLMRTGISDRAVRHQLAVFVSLSLRAMTSSAKSSGRIWCEQLATSVLKCGITFASGFINPHTFCPTFSQTAWSESEFTSTASSTYDIFWQHLFWSTEFTISHNTAIIHPHCECASEILLHTQRFFFETGTTLIQNFKCVV